MKKLLKLAAKEAGIKGVSFSNGSDDDGYDNGIWEFTWARNVQGNLVEWNPFEDDGDALRLGVTGDVFSDPRFIHERDVAMLTKGMKKLEATRWAITTIMAERQRAKKAAKGDA